MTTCGCPAFTAGYSPSTVVTYSVAAGMRTDMVGLDAPGGWATISGPVADITPLTHTVKVLIDGDPDRPIYVGGHGGSDVFVSAT